MPELRIPRRKGACGHARTDTGMREGWQVPSWSGAGPWGGSGWGPGFLRAGLREPEVQGVKNCRGLLAQELGSLAPQKRGSWGFA